MKFWRVFSNLAFRGPVALWLLARVVYRTLEMALLVALVWSIVFDKLNRGAAFALIIAVTVVSWYVSTFLAAATLDSRWRVRQRLSAPNRTGPAWRYLRGSFRDTLRGSARGLRSGTEMPNADGISDAESRDFYMGMPETSSSSYGLPYALARDDFELKNIIHGLYTLFHKEFKSYPWPEPMSHYSIMGPPTLVAFLGMAIAYFMKAYLVSMIFLGLIAVVAAPVLGLYNSLYQWALPLMQAEALWILLDPGTLEEKKQRLNAIGMPLQSRNS